MKYIIQLLIILVLHSCNSNTQPQQEVQPSSEKIVHIDTNQNRLISKPSLTTRNRIPKALKALKQVSLFQLPFETTIGSDYNDSIVSKLIDNHQAPSVLDSLFRSKDLTPSWMFGYTFNFPDSSDTSYCKFLTRLDGPNEQHEYLVYILNDQSNYAFFNLLYLVIVDKENLSMIDNSHFGFGYFKTSNYHDDYYLNYSTFKIDSTLEIHTKFMESNWESASNETLHKQQITNRGEIIEKSSMVYELSDNYDANICASLTFKHQYTITNVEIDYGEGYNREFYSNIELKMWNEAKQKYTFKSIKDTIFHVSDFLNRDWLEFYTYQDMENLQFCDKENDANCYQSHYVQYVYDSDSDPKCVFEVKYKKLGRKKIELKLRSAYNKEKLKYTDWKVIHLPQYQDYSEEGIDLYDSVRVIPWSFEFYFSKHIPFSVFDVEPSVKNPKDIERQRIKTYIKGIHSEINSIEHIGFNGDLISNFQPIKAPLPKWFLKGEKVDTTWEIVVKPGFNKYEYVNALIVSSPKDSMYYLIVYNNYKSAPVHIESIEKLPRNRKLYSTRTGLEFIEEELSGNRFVAMKTKLNLANGYNIRRSKEIVKEIIYSESNSKVILSINYPKAFIRFSSEDAIIPHSNYRRTYTDAYNRDYIKLTTYKKGKYGSYFMYLYESSNIKTPSNIVEVNYKILPDTSIDLVFRSGKNEDELMVTPSVNHKIYPKSHKKYKPWKRRYFQADSEKALKQMIKTNS